MVTRADDQCMFVCDCPSCGRRELRSTRWLIPRDRSWWSVCRRCGADVLVVDRRPATAPTTQAA